jgi:hypothetical protein
MEEKTVERVRIPEYGTNPDVELRRLWTPSERMRRTARKAQERCHYVSWWRKFWEKALKRT